jgi:hypothetical protein
MRKYNARVTQENNAEGEFARLRHGGYPNKIVPAVVGICTLICHRSQTPASNPEFKSNTGTDQRKDERTDLDRQW